MGWMMISGESCLSLDITAVSWNEEISYSSGLLHSAEHGGEKARLTVVLSGYVVLHACHSEYWRQVAGEVETQPRDRAVNQIAMMLAIMGLGLSYYSR
ncbi:hypothetical protein NHX12_001480 [Muraenolepis orangiensis]|uniref:Uncharacterized protein n=1 Tax=Muraenolepis orangiensis TaxID=630683 RepID=A0A9Q0E347_9TELE|nr:hypothetical protein NHX12_001480 [Muraenolepis orangiensis]